MRAVVDAATAMGAARPIRDCPTQGKGAGWPGRKAPRWRAWPAGLNASRTAWAVRQTHIRRDTPERQSPLPIPAPPPATYGSNNGQCACSTPCRMWRRPSDRRLPAQPGEPQAGAGTRTPGASSASGELNSAKLPEYPATCPAISQDASIAHLRHLTNVFSSCISTGTVVRGGGIFPLLVQQKARGNSHLDNTASEPKHLDPVNLPGEDQQARQCAGGCKRVPPRVNRREYDQDGWSQQGPGEPGSVCLDLECRPLNRR
jgi:hypothetical protein